MNKKENDLLMEKIISLCKRRGFIFQGSEIYGGLGGTWDYGHLGVLLKNNIKNSWWKKFVESREDVYGIDASILMNQEVWRSSGHIDTFTDPLVECSKCKSRFREDALKVKGKCDKCGSPVGEARLFNMMFKTQVGPVEDSSLISYLRPETAQGIFVNFKNIIDSFHPKLPFGIAQIGKAFRNEITPRDFIFRTREFEQMEIEYFVKKEDWEKYFNYWKDETLEWIEEVGLDQDKIHYREIEPENLAHYSERTIDVEFDFPFGQKELFGLAYRTDYDLKNHNLFYLDEESKEKIIPHTIEPSFGLDRIILALLLSSYREDEIGEETRPFLSFRPTVAPIICAVSPLLKNKPELRDYAYLIYRNLKDEFGRVMWDDNGNIGKRYRRQDEIGTPWCIVVDFDTIKDDMVTIRDRDTAKQERVKKEDIVNYIKERME